MINFAVQFQTIRKYNEKKNAQKPYPSKILMTEKLKFKTVSWKNILVI